MMKEIIILSFCLLVMVSLTTAEEEGLIKTPEIKKPAGDMDMMETAETKYKGYKGGGGGGGGGHKKGGGGHYHGGGHGGGGGYKGGKGGFKKG